MKITLPKDSLEKAFAVLVLELFSGAILQVSSKVDGAAVDQVNGNPKMQIVWLTIYLITFLLTLRQWKQLIHVVTRDKLLLLLVGIALFSAFWSVAPMITIRRSAALVGTSLFGVYLAVRYTPRELLRLLAWTFCIGAVLSLVFALALPAYGTMFYEGSTVWRGIYRHKNLLGRLMALNAVILVLLAPSIRKHLWVLWAGFALSVSLLLLSQTKTGLVIFVVLLGLLPIYKALWWNNALLLPFLIVLLNVGGIVAIWFINNLEPLLGALGKDITLTGRTNIWAAVLYKIQERLILGYGYGAFWTGETGEAGFVWQILSWNAPNSHNGILDLWLDVGLLGVTAFLLGLVISFIRGVRWARLTKTAEPILVLEYLTFILIDSQSTAVILAQNDIFWTLYVALVLSIPRFVSNKMVPAA